MSSLMSDEQKKRIVNQPYDRVFRTVINKGKGYVIPIVNEAFDDNYPMDTEIIFRPNEHFISKQDTDTDEIITDTVFALRNNIIKQYHFECESNPKNHTIVVKLFEYDTQIASKGVSEDGKRMRVEFPNTAVLYLRHNSNTPDYLEIEVVVPTGKAVSYSVPVIKVQNYTIDELFNKKLLLLIPFYIFSLEKKLDECEQDEKELRKLQQLYEDIVNRLDKLEKDGEIDAYVKGVIISTATTVIANLNENRPKVWEGVGDYMSGAVLRCEVDDILDEGIEKGKLEMLFDLVRQNLLTVAQAASQVNLSEEAFKNQMKGFAR